MKFNLFGDKKKQEESPSSVGRGFPPTDRVKELSNKGFSEPEMIDILRKEGFGADEIDRALTQVLKMGVTGEEQTPELPTLQDIQHPSNPQMQPLDQPTMPQIPERSMQYPEGYGTEEMVESIVHERMGEVSQRFTELMTKQAELERYISNLHHQLSILSKGRTQTEQSILAKLDSYKDSLDEMNGKVSSLEKAFKDALPALIESVRSLTDLVQRMKKEA
jgi:hypothetical protein